MTQSIMETLESADDEHAEHPLGFDREALLHRLRALQPLLEEIAARRFELDDEVQDASFCADLSIQRPGDKPNWVDTVFALRFSNFGSLFTTWSHCEIERLSESTRERLITAAEQAGFRFVPFEALESPYFGRYVGAHGATWLSRYFDYL